MSLQSMLPSHHFLMRNFSVALYGIFLCLSFAPDAHAAKSATGRATAEIIRAIHVESKSPLSFGELQCSSHAGKVTVTPRDQRNVSGAVDIKGSYYPASFTVYGTPYYYYHISTPDWLLFHVREAHDNHYDHNRHDHDDDDDCDGCKDHHRGPEKKELLVKDFTTFSRNMGGGQHMGNLGHHGQDTLYVGGTLIVPPNAAAGYYRGYVPISVSYQ